MKTKVFLVAMMSVFSFATVSAAPGNDNEKEGIRIVVTDKASPQTAERMAVLQARLDEINSLNYEELSAEEQAQIKNELRSIKKEVRAADGVYLYLGGGVLLVILLLILLL
jgi:hypothetical protein